MKPNEQETRETFRNYAINTRPVYIGITGPAETLADNLRAAIVKINAEHARETAGAALIATEADKRAAIEAVINEVREVLEWELIGKEKAERRENYRVVENPGGIVTVWDKRDGFGFRFKKGDTFAQYTLTVIVPNNENTTPEGMEAIHAATDQFLTYAAERFPVEFGPGSGMKQGK